MNYSDEIAFAEALATFAHRGQVDKSGEPYIDHPRRVADRMPGPSLQAVAWLHDVVEDTDISLVQVALHFRPEVVDAVDALTHRAEEPREAYYRRVAANDIAYEVKLADLADNTDPNRMAKLDADTRRRLTSKYAKAHRLLAEFRNSDQMVPLTT